MDKSQRISMWLAVAASFLVGLLLVWNDSAPGWFLIIMGAVYLGMLTRPGQGLAASRPPLVKWGFIGHAAARPACGSAGGHHLDEVALRAPIPPTVPQVWG